MYRMLAILLLCPTTKVKKYQCQLHVPEASFVNTNSNTRKYPKYQYHMYQFRPIPQYLVLLVSD